MCLARDGAWGTRITSSVGVCRESVAEARCLYAITEEGDLLYYRHPEDPTGERQFEVASLKIGAGWDQFKMVVAASGEYLYAVTEP